MTAAGLVDGRGDSCRTIAVVCDAGGVVRDHIRSGCMPRPERLIECVTPFDRERALALLSSCVEGPVNTILDVQGSPLHVFVSRIDHDLRLVAAAPHAADIVKLCDDITHKTPEHAIAASMIAVAAMPSEPFLSRWDEISRLNNELANAHRELSQVNGELRRLNAEKNQLLGIAAHDLRSPLAAVAALCDLLGEGEKLSADDTRIIIERIRSSTGMMLSLVDQVLSATAIEHGTVTLQKEQTDLRAAIEEVLAVCRPLADRREVVLRSESSGGTLMVHADRSKLLQILQNLVTNAIGFSPRGAQCLVSSSGNGQVVDFAVHDSGPGIDPSQVERLFQPFERGSSPPEGERKGAGLGLAIVRRLVLAHRGSIAVESEPGRGTTIRVSLPAE